MDVRIPVTANLHIENFSGGTVTELASGSTNGIVQTKGQSLYLTQRPGINISEDASTLTSDAKGRGITYWATNGIVYIINNGTLYKGSQGVVLSTAPATGTNRCYFFPINGMLIMLDPQNDEGWSISTGDAVTAISDVNFPPNQTPAVPLACGGTVLNTVFYVLGENGIVYGSAPNDGTVWPALKFIGATRDPDGGTYLGKHHDNVVAFGPATMEFFYDAGNPTGSPLSRRSDIYFNIGCGLGESVWEISDRIFFVGVDAAGALGVYVLEDFTPRKISPATLDSMLTQAVVKDGYTIIGSGFSGAGHDFYIMTFITTPDDILPETSFAYDATTGLWSIWSTGIVGNVNFPLIAWTKRDGVATQYGQGILSTGDMVQVNDDLIPTDTLLATDYVEAGYVEIGYVVSTAAEGLNIPLETRTGQYDGGTNRYKYPVSVRFVGDRTVAAQELNIQWSDEDNASFNTGRAQDMSINSKEHRLGRFQRRNHNMSYDGDEAIWLEGLEMSLEVGNN